MLGDIHWMSNRKIVVGIAGGNDCGLDMPNATCDST